VEIIRADIPEYLRSAPLSGVGLAFADPPYAHKRGNAVLRLLSAPTVLDPEAMCVIEHGDQEYILPCEVFEPTWQGSFGGSVVDILRRVRPVA
jgi:16S rRNA G966 N2-methylase RsmD